MIVPSDGPGGEIFAAMVEHLGAPATPRGRAIDPASRLPVYRRIIPYGRVTIGEALADNGKDLNLLGSSRDEARAGARAVKRFASAVKRICGAPFDVCRVLDGCQAYDPGSGLPCSLGDIVKCDASCLREMFFAYWVSGGGWNEANEEDLTSCLTAKLTAIFGDEPDLMHRDLTDAAVVQPDDIRSLADCFWDANDSICGLLFDVALREVGYATAEVFGRCCDAVLGNSRA